MKRVGIALLVATFVLFGALWSIAPAIPDAPKLPGSHSEGFIDIDGLARRYELYVPSSVTANPPLLIALHGSSMDATALREWTFWRFDELAEQEGFVLAYAEGFEREWNGCRAPGVTEADRRNLDDVGFVTAIVERLARDLAIDSRRVYALGLSNGGQMAYRLATERPDVFAAVAAVIAQVPEDENSDCLEPAGPIPVLIMNGTADPVVPWNGGIASLFGISARGRVQSTDRSIAHWRAVNGLEDAKPQSRWVPDRDPDDGSRVEVTRWSEPGRSEVVLYAIHGGGHAFPGGISLGSRWLTGKLFGFTNQDIDGAAEIWDFFAAKGRSH